MKRKTEYVLGLIGSIIGAVFGLFVLFGSLSDLRGDKSAFVVKQALLTRNWGICLIILSIIGIVSILMVSSKTKLSGMLMTITSAAFLISLFIILSKLAKEYKLHNEIDTGMQDLIFSFLLSPAIILLLISGIMAIVKKDKFPSTIVNHKSNENLQNAVQQLKGLKELLDNNIISQEEFNKKKEQLLKL